MGEVEMAETAEHEVLEKFRAASERLIEESAERAARDAEWTDFAPRAAETARFLKQGDVRDFEVLVRGILRVKAARRAPELPAPL